MSQPHMVPDNFTKYEQNQPILHGDITTNTMYEYMAIITQIWPGNCDCTCTSSTWYTWSWYQIWKKSIQPSWRNARGWMERRAKRWTNGRKNRWTDRSIYWTHFYIPNSTIVVEPGNNKVNLPLTISHVYWRRPRMNSMIAIIVWKGYSILEICIDLKHWLVFQILCSFSS